MVWCRVASHHARKVEGSSLLSRMRPVAGEGGPRRRDRPYTSWWPSGFPLMFDSCVWAGATWERNARMHSRLVLAVLRWTALATSSTSGNRRRSNVVPEPDSVSRTDSLWDRRYESFCPLTPRRGTVQPTRRRDRFSIDFWNESLIRESYLRWKRRGRGGGDSFQIIYLELVEEEATVVSTLIIERRGGHRYPLFKSNRGGWLLPYDVVACFPDHRGFTFLSDKIEIVGRGEYCCNPLHEKLGANWAQRTVTREANWRKQSVRGVRPFPLFPITDYLRGSNRIVSTWPVYTWLARHYLQLLGITGNN